MDVKHKTPPRGSEKTQTIWGLIKKIFFFFRRNETVQQKQYEKLDGLL